MTGVLDILEPLFLKTVDRLYRRLPQPRPTRQRLRRCRIVSHRGEHDNVAVFENTLPAFEAAADAGVWGLEMDLRWTRDMIPVVIHDPDLQRLYGRPERIADLTLAELNALDVPVPTLSAVVGRFGGQRHLMVEIKAGTLRHPDLQNRRLKVLFDGLTAERDFHLISLAPQEFSRIHFVHPGALLPISRLNIRRLERQVYEKGYGGLTGHFLFMTTARLRRLWAAGRRAGTGFVNHRRILYREIRRGVDWIFSDRAVYLQGICQM